MKKYILSLCLLALAFASTAQTFAVVPDIIGFEACCYSEKESIEPAYLVINHMTGADTIDIGNFTITPEEFHTSPCAYSTVYLVSQDMTGSCIPVWWGYSVSVGCEEALELHISNLVVYLGNRSLLDMLPKPKSYFDYIGLDYGW